MSKAKELINVTQIVFHILDQVPETRNSDDILYFKVCETINPTDINEPFWKFLLNRKLFKYPAFETVRRARQKMQAEYPHLKGCEKVEEQRALNEAIYREYARKGRI